QRAGEVRAEGFVGREGGAVEDSRALRRFSFSGCASRRGGHSVLVAARRIAHDALVREILLAIGSREDVRAWAHPTGALPVKTAGGEFWMKFGLKGSPDIMCVVGP